MKKYLFFDIDGTLTSHKVHNQIPDSTRVALEELKKNGHFVCLATGRAHFRAMDFARMINVGNVVSEGGNSLTIDFEEVSYTNPNQDHMKDLIRRCQEHGLPLCISNDDTNRRFTDDLPSWFEVAGNDTSFIVVREKQFDLDEVENIRRFMVKTDMPFLKALPPYEGIGLMGYEWSPYFFIEPNEKYHGIEKMVEMLGGNKEDIVVFGDGINDISMFEDAPFRIAMENACDELKEMADYITGYADEDGIYDACKHFGWI